MECSVGSKVLIILWIFTSTRRIKFIWILTPLGNFTPQSYQKLLAFDSDESSSTNDHNFPWKSFWKSKPIAPKIHMFMCSVLRDGIGVSAKVGKYIDGGPRECHLCQSAEETTSYLFI